MANSETWHLRDGDTVQAKNGLQFTVRKNKTDYYLYPILGETRAGDIFTWTKEGRYYDNRKSERDISMIVRRSSGPWITPPDEENAIIGGMPPDAWQEIGKVANKVAGDTALDVLAHAERQRELLEREWAAQINRIKAEAEADAERERVESDAAAVAQWAEEGRKERERDKRERRAMQVEQIQEALRQGDKKLAETMAAMQAEAAADAGPEEVPQTAWRALVLDTARELIMVDRSAVYGPPVISFGSIAHLWTGYLRARGLFSDDQKLAPSDAAAMMAQMKDARGMHGPYRPDDSHDELGYGALKAELRRGEHEAEREIEKKEKMREIDVASVKIER